MLLTGCAGGIIQLSSPSDDTYIIYIFRSDPALSMIQTQRCFTMRFHPNNLEHLHLTVAREEFTFTGCHESNAQTFNRDIIAAHQ